ncbi:MAG TPA: DUF5063 domain-containing protein [Gemmataceae bacterium]|nr:DUF5063 domain-containing protein [Gemmataceae bacterium]
MDVVERFAIVAAEFQQWALHGTDEGELGARQALLLLTKLYLTGLELAPAWRDALDGETGDKVGIDINVGDDEWRAVMDAVGRMPLAYYSDVFDLLTFPPQEPGTRTLGDDIADIYRDAVRGLRQYLAGRRSEAIWYWRFHLWLHWGEHATSAIRALHCWLTANVPEL